MSKEERKEHEWFDIFVDVRKYGWVGVFKMQNEKWEAILSKDSLKKQVERSSILKINDSRIQLGLWN